MFSSNAKKKDENKRNIILTIIKRHPYVLDKFIRKITGINFSIETTFDDMMENFMVSEGYYYRYVNQFHLPFSFLNMQKSINLHNRFIYENGDYVEELIKSLKNSQHYSVVDNQIQRKSNSSGYVQLHLYLTNHKKQKSGKEIVELRIVESETDEENIIFKKKSKSIKMNLLILFTKNRILIINLK